jgi:hypothetical protein
MNTYIEEIRKVLTQEEIDFRLVGKLLELAVGELYRELLLLLGEKIERERQKRERPAGRKDAVPRMTLREFFEKEILPLHKEKDWEEKAMEVREKILRGEFAIKTLEDFIGYLYAYTLYEDVPALFEELLMRPTPPALNLG